MEKIFRSSNLTDMLETLQSLVKAAQNYELENELSRMHTTYATMLRYMVQGVDDPNATHLYTQLVRQSYIIADRANRQKRIREKANEKYSITLKYSRKDLSLDAILISLDTQCKAILQLRKEPYERESIQQHKWEQHQTERENMLKAMFEYIWTSDVWQRSDYERATELLNSDTIDTQAKCVFISAVTLSLIEMFDERKFMLLFDAYLSNQLDINQRAIIALIILLKQYEQRIPKFPEVNARLSLYLEDPKFVRDAFRIMMQLQQSRLTENISSKMREDIIPTIMQSTQFKRTQFGIEEIDDYMTKNGENPEWHHNQADEKAQTKLQEMAELQMEGADVYMSTFSYMKGYQFFHYMANWFTPFSADNPDLTDAKKHLEKETGTTNVITTLMRFAPFCDSDKYSFYFMMESIGTVGRDQISQSLNRQMSGEELDEQLQEVKTYKPKAKDISRNYIYDLYRFFQLYPYHQQFPNPFAKELPVYSPLNCTVLTPLLEQKEEVLQLAEFLMRKGFYLDAVQLFMKLNPQETEDDADIWQKIGFCYQKNKDFESALTYYTVAFKLKSTSSWTLKHLAQTAYQLKKYENAEVYYDMLLDDDSENLRYLTRKIDCLMQTSQYTEALPLLYKVTYLNEDNEELKDLLAWCQLLAGNTEKAKLIYTNDLLPQNSQPTTLMHAGCTLLVDGKLSEAYQMFKQAYEQLKNEANGVHTFKQQFVECARVLKPLGIEVSRCEMLYDAVRIGLE